MLIYHRESSVAVFYHDIFNIICIIICLEGDQIILLHDMLHRNTLIDQSCHAERIQGRLNDHTLIFLRRIFNILFNLCVVADDNAAYVLLYGTEMILMPVPQDDKIIFLQEFSHVDNAGKPESQNNIVSMAYQYIMSNFSKNISVSDIARSVQCTPNYLTRMFKEYYGKTTIQFLNSVKIEYAKHLLTTTTLPIKIIAIRSGFSSDLHFRKIFKQLEGCNPRSYQYSLSRIRIDPK